MSRCARKLILAYVLLPILIQRIRMSCSLSIWNIWYVEHRSRGYTPLLFVRELRRLPSGQAAPYAFLGPAEYVSHEGSRPMSIIWKLRYPTPARMLRPLARQRVG